MAITFNHTKILVRNGKQGKNVSNLKYFTLTTSCRIKILRCIVRLTRLASLLRFTTAEEQNDGQKLPQKFYLKVLPCSRVRGYVNNEVSIALR